MHTGAQGPTLQSLSVRVSGTPSRTVPRLRLLAALVNVLRVRLREHAGSGPRRRLQKNVTSPGNNKIYGGHFYPRTPFFLRVGGGVRGGDTIFYGCQRAGVEKHLWGWCLKTPTASLKHGRAPDVDDEAGWTGFALTEGEREP